MFLLTFVNVVLSLCRGSCMALIAATAISAATSPYSMAVALQRCDDNSAGSAPCIRLWTDPIRDPG